MKSEAVGYAHRGWRIFPLHNPTGDGGCSCKDPECTKIGKHPRIGLWQQLATADPEQVTAWWSKYESANIALSLDGLIVLDIDPRHGGFESLEALEREHEPLAIRSRQRSGRGGYHFLFRAVAGTAISRGFRPGLDFLMGEGCYIVGAPSLHACGDRYEWDAKPHPGSVSQSEIQLNPPPQWLLDVAAGASRKSGAKASPKNTADSSSRVPLPRLIGDALDKLEVGDTRNNTGFWLFQQMRDNRFSKQEAMDALPDWVQATNDATPAQERYATSEAKASLESAWKSEPREPWKESKPRKKSQADELLELTADFEHFRSGPANDPYIRFQTGNHKEVWPATEKKIREVLTSRYLMVAGRAPSRDALNSVADTTIGRCGSGTKQQVFIRFARSVNVIYLDLCKDNWEIVEVTKYGWRVLRESPVLFRRPSGALPLPEPERGGSLDSLRSLLNAGSDDRWTLLMAWLVGVFQPAGAFSHLLLEGGQGSGKTFAARLLLHTVDPNEAGLSAPPRDEADATIAAMNSGVLGFDNLSGCRAELSDVFCRFSTGQGYKTRTLHTTTDLTIITVKIPLVLNGIGDNVMRPDLLERTICLHLPRIERQNRQTEQVMWARFNDIHPKLLGALLDAVSAGLNDLPTTHLSDPPRMADFAHWVSACERGLPWKQGTFIAAYNSAATEAGRNLVEGDSVASAITDWVHTALKPGKQLLMSAREMLAILNDRSGGVVPRDARLWPQNAEGLAYRLTRLVPVLLTEGVEVVKLKRTAQERSRWLVRRLTPQGGLNLEPNTE